MEIRILIVEDDKHIRETVKAYLTGAGYLVDACADGDTAQEFFYEKKYQLIILDIMLPGISGHELLKELRKNYDTPVLMMTALDDELNEIKAFTNKADDYVTKPFSFEVLLKRVDALLRRSGLLKEIRLGKLTLYPESYRAEYDGIDLRLTTREFNILFFLFQNKGKVLSYERILTEIWGYGLDGSENAVRLSIMRLREKLPVSIIKTVKGVGYFLEDLI